MKATSILVCALILSQALLLCRATQAHAESVGAILAPAETTTESPGAARFHAATNLARNGDPAGAAQDLIALTDELPDDAFSDDALAEAARLKEGPLGDPVGALLLYRRLLAAYPDSRLARRASARAQDISRSTGHDGRFAPALAELEMLRTRAPHLAPAQTIERLQAVLTAHPDLPDRRQVNYWLGSAYERAGRVREALLAYAAVDGDGDDAWWVRARRAQGDLLLAEGDADAARAVYDRLASSSQPQALHVGKDALDRLQTVTMRRAIARGAWIVLAVWCLWLAWQTALHRRTSGRFGLWPPPTEALFLLPIAGLFILASASSNRILGPAVEWSIVCAVLLTWWSGAVQRARQTQSSAVRRRGLVHAFGSLCAIVAVLFLVVHEVEIIDYLVETWRHGPER